MENQTLTSISLALVAIASLAGALFLTWNGDDATPAWASLTGAVGLLAGRQMETPASKGVGANFTKDAPTASREVAAMNCTDTTLAEAPRRRLRFLLPWEGIGGLMDRVVLACEDLASDLRERLHERTAETAPTVAADEDHPTSDEWAAWADEHLSAEDAARYRDRVEEAPEPEAERV